MFKQSDRWFIWLVATTTWLVLDGSNGLELVSFLVALGLYLHSRWWEARLA